MIEEIINNYTDKMIDFFVKNYQLYKSNRNSSNLEFLKKGIKSYLRKCRTNYYVKSLLYKEKGEYIDDIYVDIPLMNSKNRKMSRENIVDDIIAKYIAKDKNENNINSSSYILISGIGGCGKSVLMKKLFLDFLDAGTRRVFLPILIRLKSLSEEEIKEFEDYIKNYFSSINIDFDSYLMECLLKSGNILLLLDGLDELSFEEKENFLASLDTFKKRYDMISIIISARPEVRPNSFPDFEQYEMTIMDENKVQEYIDKLPDSFEKKVEVKERILDPVYYDKHHDLVGYPLMLAILLLTFDYNGELPVNR